MPQQKQEVFGKYHLLEKIATGGMAEVYRARSYGVAGFEKILVIKRILDNIAEDREFIALFIDEARLAAQLLHANIVQVFELGEINGSHYMAMEYVHGLDLARLLARAYKLGPFPIPLALYIGREVLKALQYAHEKVDEEGRPLNVVHCDISPQNILVSYAGEVKITDFGISRAAFQAASRHRVIRGKYAYMSPEQVEGKPLTGQSDLFSLGVVLWEMLAGRRLFKTRSREETLNRVRRAEVPSLRSYRPEVSEEIEALLLRALARRPQDRFASAGEMLEVLTTLMLRRGYRATDADLATFIRDVIERTGREPSARPRSGRAPPTALVVMAAEASPPPRSIAAPRTPLASLMDRWVELVDARGGELWEHGEGSILAVWRVQAGLRDALGRAVDTALRLQKLTLRAGYRLSAGIVPGVARIRPGEQRPPEGWELAGPFYLSRWMMNLSAHRGRVLLTEVGRRQVTVRTTMLGRIPIEGNRFINLYEVG